MKLRQILILPLIFISGTLLSQTRVVHGTLTAFNTYPVQNVEVKAKKTGAMVSTDSLGQFSIVCEKKDVIQIRAKAFQPLTVRVSKKTETIKRNLIFINNEENRQYATGYGYISEDNLTYAISHLDAENNDLCNYSDVFDLIVGRFPGVTVQSSSSGGRGVYIRGSNSINLSSEALYVVNDIVNSNIDYISPCEVKSIDVLKDASASLYGARGANGVVVIYLK